MQACAALPNFAILEHAYGETDWRHTLVEPAEPLADEETTELSLADLHMNLLTRTLRMEHPG